MARTRLTLARPGRSSSAPGLLPPFLLPLAILGSLAAARPVPASAAAAPQHLVYVAALAADGTVTDERSIGCDLALPCEVVLPVGDGTVMLRLFAEDASGVSLSPIVEDGDGRLARGRRQDIAWGRSRSIQATVPVRALAETGGDGLFDRGLREDLPPHATLLVAVTQAASPGEAKVTLAAQ
jgi:hypothetical protein